MPTGSMRKKVSNIIGKLDTMLIRALALIKNDSVQEALAILMELDLAINHFSEGISQSHLVGSNHVLNYMTSVLLSEIKFFCGNDIQQKNIDYDDFFELRIRPAFDAWSRELEWQLGILGAPASESLALNEIKNTEKQQRILIGLLAPNKMNVKLNLAFHYMCKSLDVEFVAFFPSDIKYTTKQIEGQVFHNGKWITKLTRFPDFIHDRLRMRGLEGFSDVYEVFKKIPFSNDRPGSSIDKVAAFDRVKNHPDYGKAIIPYDIVESASDVHPFLSLHKDIILKPRLGSYGQNIIRLTKKTESIELRYDDQIRDIDDGDIDYLVSENIRMHFVMQKYIKSVDSESAPFDIRVHVMKNGSGNWEIAAIYPKIGRPGRVVSNRSVAGGYTTIWPEFFASTFPNRDFSQFDHKLRAFAISFAEFFQETEPANLNEIGLDIGIQQDLKFWIFEININRVGESFHEFDVARLGVEYALYRLNKIE